MRTYSSIFIILLIFSCGCGGNDGPERGQVQGTVTLDGKPVPNAQVSFFPQNITKRNIANGFTNKDGKYTLSLNKNQSGALIAESLVTVSTQKYTADEVAGYKEMGITVTEDFVKLPEKYSKQGELKYEVKKGNNEINIDLKSN